MAGLDSATGGRARLGNTEITELPDADLSILGRCLVGLVIQSSTPMPRRDVRRNILLAFELSTDDAPPTPTLRWSAAAGRTPPIALHRMIGSSAADQRRGVCSVPRSCSDPTCDPRGGPLTRGEGVVGFQSQPPTSSTRNSLRALTGRQSGTFPGPIALS